MTERQIKARPLAQETFAPFGTVVDRAGAEPRSMNGGMARRFHDLTRVDVVGDGARVTVGIVEGNPYPMPLGVSLVERHPLGDQAFLPLGDASFIVVVCPDEGGRPGRPLAFVTAPGQGVRYAMNVWHGVLTPFGVAQDFVVVDRGGPGVNLEEHVFDEPWSVTI